MSRKDRTFPALLRGTALNLKLREDENATSEDCGCQTLNMKLDIPEIRLDQTSISFCMRKAEVTT